MRHKLPFLILGIALGIAPISMSHADGLRMGGQLGSSSAAISASLSNVRVGSSNAYGVFLEKIVSPTWALGVSFHQALDNSWTEFSPQAKFFFWTPPTGRYHSDALMTDTQVVQKTFSPYLTGQLGFASAMIVSTTAGSSSLSGSWIFGAGGLGLEYPLGGKTGLTVEADYGTTFTGTTEYQNMKYQLGVYFYL
jgi:hypothetical protein